jgi:cell filamentation protein
MGDFTFAASSQIPKLMEEFEKGPLRDFTPCGFDTIEETAKALAVVHTELVLIHPFRDGNGRLARLLATLMALQSGLPPLDFSSLKGYRRKAYYEAIQAGLDRDYKPMEDVFSGVIRRSLRKRKA